MKEKFIEIYKNNIKREGGEKLLEWLEKTDFFIAPSSTKFHGNYEGGLVEHSINVYNCLKMLVDDYKKQFPDFEISEETIAITSLLHDLCKTNYYVKGYRNVKNEETGQWEKKEIYNIEDKLCMGHGEGSVYMIQAFMKLTREEAINKMLRALDEFTIEGIESNIDFQIDILNNDIFRLGTFDTSFISKEYNL